MTFQNQDLDKSSKVEQLKELENDLLDILDECKRLSSGRAQYLKAQSMLERARLLRINLELNEVSEEK